MVSQGKDVPAIDYHAQAPDGFQVFNTPIIMEYIVGSLHRLPFLNNIPFHRFVEYFCWYFSALSIFSIFLLCFFIISHTGISLLATLYFAISLPFIARTVNGFFEREIFTLPFIILHLYFFMRSLHSKKRMDTAIASVLIVIVVGSWEISKFYLLLFMVYPVLKFILSKKTDEFKEPFFNYSLYQIITLISACLLVPYMRYRSFIFSLPMIVCYGFFIIMLITRYISLSMVKKFLIFLGTCLLFILVFPKNKDYTHVYAIFFYKIVHFLKKPVDPGRIPFDARALWEGPFRSPVIRKILYTFSTFLIWGGLSIWFLIKKFLKKKLNLKLEFLLFINIVFFACFLLFERLHVFAIIALAVSFGYCVLIIKTRLSRKYLFYFFSLLLLSACFEFYKTWTFLSGKPFFSTFLEKILPAEQEFGYRTDSIIKTIEWIKSNTKTNDVILARYALCPSILIYTGRPVTLTPYFEPVSMRDRVYHINSAYYQDERSFYNICRKYKVNYFIYGLNVYLDTTAYSVRYLMDKMVPDKEETVYYMQFHPDKLRNFKLVFQNETFRVFKVLDKEGNDNKDIDYYPCYDEKIFQQINKEPFEFLMRWYDAYLSKIWGDYYFSRKLFTQAEDYFKKALDIFPFYPQVLEQLSRIALLHRRYNEAYQYLKKSLSITYSVSANYGMAALSLMQGDTRGAYLKLKNLVSKNPSYIPALADLSKIYKARGHYREAIRLTKRIISIRPNFIPAYYELESLYRIIGEKEQAEQLRIQMKKMGQ